MLLQPRRLRPSSSEVDGGSAKASVIRANGDGRCTEESVTAAGVAGRAAKARVRIINMKDTSCRPRGGRRRPLPWAWLVLLLMVGAASASGQIAPRTDVGADGPDSANPRSLPLKLDDLQSTPGGNSTSAPSTPGNVSSPSDQAATTGSAGVNGSTTNGQPDQDNTAGQSGAPAADDEGEDIEKRRLDSNAPRTSAGDSDSGSYRPSMWNIVPALALVLALLAGAVWAARKYLPGVRQLGASPAVRVLGRTHLSPRQSVMLVKVGRRVLIVGSTADGLRTLDSITDPAEVSELVGLAEMSRAGSATTSFNRLLKQADDEFSQADQPLDDLDGPAAIVTLSGQGDDGLADEERAADMRQLSNQLSAADDEDDAPTAGRIRTELDQLRRKVREVIGKQD